MAAAAAKAKSDRPRWANGHVRFDYTAAEKPEDLSWGMIERKYKARTDHGPTEHSLHFIIEWLASDDEFQHHNIIAGYGRRLGKIIREGTYREGEYPVEGGEIVEQLTPKYSAAAGKKSISQVLRALAEEDPSTRSQILDFYRGQFRSFLSSEERYDAGEQLLKLPLEDFAAVVKTIPERAPEVIEFLNAIIKGEFEGYVSNDVKRFALQSLCAIGQALPSHAKTASEALGKHEVDEFRQLVSAYLGSDVSILKSHRDAVVMVAMLGQTLVKNNDTPVHQAIETIPGIKIIRSEDDKTKGLKGYTEADLQRITVEGLDLLNGHFTSWALTPTFASKATYAQNRDRKLVLETAKPGAFIVSINAQKVPAPMPPG